MNETNVPISVGTFSAIKNAVLGPDYELTLVMTTPEHIRKLNTIYRDKKAATDILSFPLADTQGEMYICPDKAKKEAVKFRRPYENFLLFLFIHGCVHLKGHDHGSTMERIEAGVRRKFNV